jgi:hypothetical protein
MKRTVFSCDKCACDFEHPTLSFVVPASIGVKLGQLLDREPVPAIDLCGDCSAEFVRLLRTSSLTLRGLENERDDASATADRCLARVRALETELAEYHPESPPTEPPQGIPDPLLDARATDLPPPVDSPPVDASYAPCEPLPREFVLPSHAFAFTTEAPPMTSDAPAASGSPLGFTHAPSNGAA